MNCNQTISIILVHPQMGENIGACARAMKNFGISDLRIVNPRDGWPNQKAKYMSVGAVDLIDKAKIYNSVSTSIADLEYVYASTASVRDMNKNYVLSRNIKHDLPSASSIGIMFGRESSGLTNSEISLANKIITIDTDVNFSSLNIAHSVAVVCYELFQSLNMPRKDLHDKIHSALATNCELEHFYTHLIKSLDDRKFFRTAEKKKHMSEKIRNIFSRIDNLSHSEIQTLRGVISTLTLDDK